MITRGYIVQVEAAQKQGGWRVARIFDISIFGHKCRRLDMNKLCDF